MKSKSEILEIYSRNLIQFVNFYSYITYLGRKEVFFSFLIKPPFKIRHNLTV